MSHLFTTSELDAYLDEALPVERMAQLEEQLRGDEQLLAQLQEAIGRRDAGMHTIGGIWRRHRLGCPDRAKWGSYLLGVLDPAEADYLRFHLEVSGCRLCRASVADLEATQAKVDAEAAAGRRQRYFQSSVGHLPNSSG